MSQGNILVKIDMFKPMRDGSQKWAGTNESYKRTFAEAVAMLEELGFAPSVGDRETCRRWHLNLGTENWCATIIY